MDAKLRHFSGHSYGNIVSLIFLPVYACYEQLQKIIVVLPLTI